ncbi:MAG TPA: C40 family peptidase [Gemmatimonadales bacterium]|nr:C40 family peptidase [Gemmatimonadales bacterium]
MSAVIARAAVAPLHAEASLRSEQVSQLVLGESAAVLAAEGMWLRVRGQVDGYEGWLHRGYAIECGDAEAEEWRAAATGWSVGAEVDTGSGRRRLPVRARAVLEHGRVRLPDGTSGPLVQGHILPEAEARRSAAVLPAEEWAARTFAGVRYEWGGVTDAGVDCSGLVQTTFAARGVRLPRDSSAQAREGQEVALADVLPGDLVFFSETGRGISHVAFIGAGNMLVHSTVACGGVLTESWAPGSRAAQLHAQYVTARRIPGAAASG